MYWEESGSSSGRAVLYLHGGPGGGFSSAARQIFNPERYRLICYDQRGCGKSRPYGDCSANNTDLLLSDIEELRAHLQIPRWLICGSSWGATLACEYAKGWRQAVEGVLLYGAFLGREKDIANFLIGGRDYDCRAWRAFSAHVGASEVDSLLAAYWDALNSSSATATAAALSWARYELALSSFPSPTPQTIALNKAAAVALARVSVHYFRSRCFLPKDGVLEGLSKLRDIPLVLVHGTHDAVCALSAAQELADHWPSARLEIVSGGGHIPRTLEDWSRLSHAIDVIAGRSKL